MLLNSLIVTVFLWPRSGLNLTSYRNMKKMRIPIAYTQPGLFTSCCLLYALRIKMGRTCKVVVCGQAAVGKTAILEQLINGDHVVGSVSLKFYFRVCYSINDPAFCPSRPMLTRGLIYKISYDNLTIMPKLRSICDGRLIYQTVLRMEKGFS